MKTVTGGAIAELQRSIFDRMIELDKTEPGDVDRIVAAIVEHLRSWRPESIMPLGTLPPPTEPIRDPRDPEGERAARIRWVRSGGRR